ncbi:MAG: serine hydroxymethyltransferase [Pseudomonadota bacterium]
MADGELNEVYFEFQAIGAQMRVSAIDGKTGTEVVVFGPVGTPDSHLKSLGIAKLRKRLGTSQEHSGASKDDGPGILV